MEKLKTAFDTTIKYIKDSINFIKNNKCLSAKLGEKEQILFDLLENDFEKKYIKYVDIQRFSIPIVGMINTGKSSFLNFLLGINCLETEQDITTKCVVIIRNNKLLNDDERYIYSVKINERIQGHFNFEKDEHTKSDNLNSIISERNKYIKNLREDEIPKKEDFFLIIEAKIPLFQKENELYGEFFEFLDLPGLDEGDNDSNCFKHSKFFKENILPKLAEISLFSIFIFDATKYMTENNPKIYTEYINEYFPSDYSNSFFILNKIDKMEYEEEENKKFKEEMLVNELRIDIKNPNIHLFFLSCLKLTKESNKYKDFYHYIEHLIINSRHQKQTNFIIYLKEKMKEEFNFDGKMLTKEIPGSNEAKEIQKKLDDIDSLRRKSIFLRFLSVNDYYKYSRAFNDIYSQKINKMNNLKIQKYHDLLNLSKIH